MKQKTLPSCAQTFDSIDVVWLLCWFDQTEGNAVGFMSISRSINLDLLSRCFELGPFHGLRKPHPEDVLVPPTPPPTGWYLMWLGFVFLRSKTSYCFGWIISIGWSLAIDRNSNWYQPRKRTQKKILLQQELHLTFQTSCTLQPTSCTLQPNLF